MLKKSPVIENLNLNVDGNPTMIEEITEFDGLYRSNQEVLQFSLEWVFKVFETLKKSTLIVESTIHQEHQIKKFIPITHEEVQETISQSYEAACDLLESELKSNGVFHRPKPLPQEMLKEWTEKLHENLTKRLF
jgi:hypothetical protein